MRLIRSALACTSPVRSALKWALPLTLAVACGDAAQEPAEPAVVEDVMSTEHPLSWVGLSSPTSSFSQSGWSVNGAFDGSTSWGTGYAIYNPSVAADPTQPTEISFRINTPLGQQAAGDQSVILIDLHQNYGSSHQIGRFRVQFTRSAHGSFAYGGDNRGAAGVRGTAAWEDFSACYADMGGTNGVTLNYQAGNYFLPSGTPPATTIYRLWCHAATAGASGNGITGLKIDFAADGSFPTAGPGRAGNGNFVLNEVGVAHQIAPRGAITNSHLGPQGCMWVDPNNLDKVFSQPCQNVGGTANAQWIKVRVNADTYVLRSALDPNKCLDTWSNSRVYTGLRTVPCNFNAYQNWHNPVIPYQTYNSMRLLRNYGDMCAHVGGGGEMFQWVCPWGGTIEANWAYHWNM